MQGLAVPIAVGAAAVMYLVGLWWWFRLSSEGAEEPRAGYYWAKGPRSSALWFGVVVVGFVAIVVAWLSR
jgi:hypothetical protein